jgi:hypothetical protein
MTGVLFKTPGTNQPPVADAREIPKPLTFGQRHQLDTDGRDLVGTTDL